jgi:hypothetical protein
LLEISGKTPGVQHPHAQKSHEILTGSHRKSLPMNPAIPWQNLHGSRRPRCKRHRRWAGWSQIADCRAPRACRENPRSSRAGPPGGPQSSNPAPEHQRGANISGFLTGDNLGTGGGLAAVARRGLDHAN